MNRFVRNKQIEDEFNKSLKEIECDPELYAEKILLDFREVIAEKMNESGLNRVDLAKKLNCSKPYITQLLNGNTDVRLGTFIKILFSLGVKPIFKYEYKDGQKYNEYQNIVENVRIIESSLKTILVDKNNAKYELEQS
ncbi:MAG: helix-turn-helix domain-containing protein [Bacteroidota bacterium]